MGIQISKIYNARVYIDGTDFIGKAEEVSLPKVTFKFDDAKALGMYGASEFPSGLDKMEANIKFNSIYPEFVALAADPFKSNTVIIRASMKKWSQDGVYDEVPLKVTLKGFFKESETGSFKHQESAEAEATMSVFYYKLEVDNKDVLEVDVLNNIYKVEGNDILQKYKQNIGG